MLVSSGTVRRAQTDETGTGSHPEYVARMGVTAL
jgi:hypothetical protein